MRPLLLLPALGWAVLAPAQIDRARNLVDPFIGTGGHGHTFPGACVPNGLVQLSPDTRTDGYMDWDGCGGYHYSDSTIYGFSHTHLSGTGVADLCDVLLMPMSGSYAFDPAQYASRFSHASEQAHAGYYRVHLDDARTDAELTATAHCGVHRYTMPADQPPFIVLDLGHRDALLDAAITFNADGTITGLRRSSSWAKDQRVFFIIRFSRPFVATHIDPVMTQRGDVVQQRPTKAAVEFAPSSAPLIVHVGISAVSIEGARKNLEAEVQGRDFDALRKQAEDAWNAKLSKVEVRGGSAEQQRTFYTALYHCYVAPYVFNDVDGQYRGMDGDVHHADHNVYTVFSLWDTFRALHPLMTILEPDMTNDFIRTFMLHYQQGGRLPVWELWGNETDCMIGYHSVSVIADAYLKGIRGVDASLALQAMVAGATRAETGLSAYIRQGFIASADAPESVSKTLEYAYDDACIASFIATSSDTARAGGTHPTGNDSLWSIFSERQAYWRNLFDPSSRFFRARYNGGFKAPFDPFEVNFNFTEANAWQYSLFVPQALDELIAAHGGERGFEAFLDALFAARNTTSGREQADITGLMGQYAHGNEPSHHMAYLYDRIGRPDKARDVVKRIMDAFYHDAPDGLIGNEDCGQMSAWYVMSALGLYQVSPGIEATYDLGYPLFDTATVHLSNGRTWSMVVDPQAVYADRPGQAQQLGHATLMAGGEQRFDGARIPALREPAPVPVRRGAYIPGPPRPKAPVIQATSASFTDTLNVTVLGTRGCNCTVEDATGTRPCPVGTPFILSSTSTVRVAWSDELAPVEGHFTQRSGARTIHLDSRFSAQYTAGGEQALVDGLRGGNDFRTGEWQGFHDTDLVATIDLGSVQRLERAGLSVFQDARAWIWYPSEVIIAWSADKHHWSSTTVQNTVPRTMNEAAFQELWSGAIHKRARYVKVVARNAGPCPPWHPGKGGPTWIFADEVLLETAPLTR